MAVTTNIQVLCDWLDPDGNTYFQLENLTIHYHGDYIYLSAAGGPDLARYKLDNLKEED